MAEIKQSYSAHGYSLKWWYIKYKYSFFAACVELFGFLGNNLFDQFAVIFQKAPLISQSVITSNSFIVLYQLKSTNFWCNECSYRTMVNVVIMNFAILVSMLSILLLYFLKELRKIIFNCKPKIIIRVCFFDKSFNIYRMPMTLFLT